MSTNIRAIIEAIYSYYRNRLSTFKFGGGKAKNQREIDKTFASASTDRTLFRMLNACYDDFVRYMATKGIAESTWNVEEVVMYKPAKADFKCIFPHPLRPKQLEIKNFIFERKDKVISLGIPSVRSLQPIRVIPLQMGGGKTLIALYVAALLGVRTMIEISKRYRQNWIDNLYGKEAKLDVKEEDVLIIMSHTDLVNALRRARSSTEKFDYKVIVAHKSTIANFVNAYVKDQEQFKEYGIKVEDLYKVLGVGLLIRDEVHEELHINAKQDLHRHIPLVINLSATLEFDDEKVNEMCNYVFPLNNRYNGGEWNKYIDVLAYHYRLQLPTKLKWMMFKKGPYSQVEFEKSILKSRQYLGIYIELVLGVINDYFIPIADKEDRILIYAHTIEMCTKLAEAAADRYPDRIVNRYVGEDDYEKLEQANMAVTTPGSAGTGVDVKGLRRVIMTNAMKSSQKNYQMAGRLRELFGKDTLFIYLVCDDIPQHRDYDAFKRQKFRGKMKSHEDFYSGFVL